MLLLVQVLAFSQNLVTNGSFETYSLCPTAKSTPSNLQVNYATGWQTAASTPDYYNSCAGIGSTINLPNAGYGYQNDCCGGSGYVGGFMVSKYATNNDDREYIYTKLIDTLKIGHKYLASMYVSRANGWDYAIATIGMLFTNTAINLPYPQSFIQANPQIKNTTLLSDTVNWILIQDTITASGNETYLTIGNFNTNATCDSVKVGGNGTHFNFAYYYIDGVSVYDIGTVGIEQNTNKEVEISVYPNPSNGKLYISNFDANEKIAYIEITDITGKMVFKQANQINNGLVELELDLTNGVYLVKFTNSKGYSQINKIIINK